MGAPCCKTQIILDATASATAAPFTTSEAGRLKDDSLPPPMHLGNYESQSDTCMVNNTLKPIALQPTGDWEWSDEQRGAHDGG